MHEMYRPTETKSVFETCGTFALYQAECLKYLGKNTKYCEFSRARFLLACDAWICYKRRESYHLVRSHLIMSQQYARRVQCVLIGSH